MTDYYLPPQIADRSWQPTTTVLTAVLDALADTGRSPIGQLQPAATAAILGEVSEAWLDPGSSMRQATEQELAASTGYSRPNVAAALDDLFTAMRPPELQRLLAIEGPDLPTARPQLVLHIPAGTVFPPAVVGPLCTLLLGSPCLIRPPRRIAALPRRWAASVAARSPQLARRLAVVPWDRDCSELTAAALARATTAVLHGDEASLAAIAQLAPASTHLLRHGHRVAAAVVGGHPLRTAAAAIADELARDIAVYDQHGCLSPHTVLVIEEDPVDAHRFAELLGAALTRQATIIPAAPTAAAGLGSLLATREIECYARDGLVLGGTAAGWTIFCSRAGTFEFSPGDRVVFVLGVESLAAAIAVLEPVRGLLQAIGLAIDDASREVLGAALGQATELESSGTAATATRLCRIGGMQKPPITWPADGLRPLVSQCSTATSP